MKIGILTFHYTINQGSVLQAYCVQELMKEWFPEARVEIINIIPFMREKHELKFYSRKFPFLKIEKFRKYRSIRQFIRKNLNLSDRKYYNSLDKQIKYINSQQYDLICTGSDTVWVDTFKLKHLIPNVYFLPTAIHAPKISVAASVDPLNNAVSYHKAKDKLKEIFDSYKLITVRDKTTQNLISEFTKQKVEIIADPTILYDFEKKMQLTVEKKFKQPIKKTIGIAVSDHHLTDLLINKLAGYGKVSNSFYSGSSKFDYVIDELDEYHKLDVLITDRFHRSIFALKLSSALIINVERENKNKNTNSKGRELFINIGLPEYALRYKKQNEEDFILKVEKLINMWDEEAFEKREKKFMQYIDAAKVHWNKIKDNTYPVTQVNHTTSIKHEN